MTNLKMCNRTKSIIRRVGFTPATVLVPVIKMHRFSDPPCLLLGLILATAVAMRVMINATGCPAPVLDRNRMNTHKHLSQLIASAFDHDIPRK